MAPADDRRSAASPTGDDLLDRFEVAWERGPVPRLEDFWAQARARLSSPAQARSLLIDLIKIDLHRRWKLQPPPTPRPLLETYLTRFPDLGRVAQLPVDLIGEEYCARRCVGEQPNHDDYVRRFPAQAASLHRILRQMDAELAEAPAPALKPAADVVMRVPNSVPAFLESLARLSILAAEHERQAAVPGFARRFSDLKALMRFLSEQAWLTSYQLEQLGLGRTHTLVVGPYVLLDRLGEGATSVVFRARHRHLQRIVALKVIRRELLGDVGPEVLERVYQEFRAAGRLSHPHVVHAYDAGPVGSTLFIAMEYIAGVNLRDLVQQQGPLPFGQACDYIRQACLALHHATRNGIVHRDIKPANLIVSGDIVKLLDLGLARIHHMGQAHSSGMLTQKGAVMGTADYMAPEQAVDAHGVDVRADLYSLGCALYFLLAGRPPFVGGTFVQKIERHRTEAPPPIEQLCRGLPADVASVVHRLLAKRPEERFGAPLEVFQALGGNLASIPSSGPGSTAEFSLTSVDERVTGTPTIVKPQAVVPAATSERAVWRRWVIPAALAAMLLLALAVGFGALVVYHYAKRSTPPADNATAASTPQKEVLRLALAIDCGKRDGEVRVQSPRYGYTLRQGGAWDSWKVTPPAKSYCWFHNDLLQFDLKVPARTTGILRLCFFDGDTNLRYQRLKVQGRVHSDIRDFHGAEKIVEIPLSAEDTRTGRIEVEIERLSRSNAVVSTVEFFERRMVAKESW
jgi:serine/threonine-protein kinase